MNALILSLARSFFAQKFCASYNQQFKINPFSVLPEFPEKEVMTKRVFQNVTVARFAMVAALSGLIFSIGCSVSAKTSDVGTTPEAVSASKTNEAAAPHLPNSAPVKGRIKFAAGSPADTVRLFYKNLRERRFREAMMLTNLRLAVEGLTEAEMKELSADFEPLALQVPEVVEINGEIITNNLATVTAKLPNDETGKLELKEIPLRMEKDSWVIVTADADAEAMAKKEGKNYFFVLKMDIHQSEAQVMMERISKAQTVHAIQNGGLYGELETLVAQGLLPMDIKTTQSTGYKYSITVLDNGRKYFASAIPDTYGKTGKLSYLLETLGNEQKTRLKFEDNKGQPLRKP